MEYSAVEEIPCVDNAILAATDHHCIIQTQTRPQTIVLVEMPFVAFEQLPIALVDQSDGRIKGRYQDRVTIPGLLD